MQPSEASNNLEFSPEDWSQEELANALSNFNTNFNTLQFTNGLPPEAFQAAPNATSSYVDSIFSDPASDPSSEVSSNFMNTLAEGEIEPEEATRKERPDGSGEYRFPNGETREERMQKNRISAAKSRKKRKAWIDGLSEKVDELQTENIKLKTIIEGLKQEKDVMNRDLSVCNHQSHICADCLKTTSNENI
ncbi:hypothetical protein BT69DRAFT_722043 [Atractiella rhizophila]|nr:hypothetical protein BT69DRAFT_722043 [Atractiella rhizophila]